MTNFYRLFILIAFLSISHFAQSQNWNQILKMCASDRAANDNFGYSVAIDGNYAVVGAYLEDENEIGESTLINPGSVYVFFYDASSGWSEVQKIVAPDRNAADQFGFSVAISGDYIVIGAPQEDENETGTNTIVNSGSAYIFVNIDSVWTPLQKICASDRNSNDYFGCSVSISGNHIIIGANEEDEDETGNSTISNSGSAYIFKNTANTWSEIQKICAPVRAAADYFGFSVAISGDYAIVGAYTEDENATEAVTKLNAGSAYIFHKIADNWNHVTKIVASDRAAEDLFGYSVAISGNYAIVGAYQEDENATGGVNMNNSGSAYIFFNNGGNWTQKNKIVAADRGIGDQFGYSVAISGDYAVVGATLEDEDQNGTNNYFNSGSAYIFKNYSGQWAQNQKIVASDRFGSDLFGNAVAISNNYIVVGAYQEDQNAVGDENMTNAGSVYLFKNFYEFDLFQNTTEIANNGTYYFGDITIGETSDTITFTIQNNGGANLHLNGTPHISLSGTNAADFFIDQDSVVSPIAPDSTVYFRIAFSPTASGLRTAEISIANDDADENPFVFTITGAAHVNAMPNYVVNSEIIVYPNPTDGMIYYNFEKNNVKHLSLTDISGKIIFETNIVSNLGSIDISGFANGIYIFSAMTDDQIIKVKLIKE